MSNPISQEQFGSEVVKQLCEAGYTAYFAGGCVRDQLLGVDPKDYDVATSALPEQVRDVFGRRSTIAVGQSFGVITVLGPKPVQVEVATFRSDGEYSDGRHPDHVEFSSPEEDATRRDFTINGMFYDPTECRVIDFVEGQADLAAKLIRAIGDPLKRIEEDRLRMLRAIRIAATYEFTIEPKTLEAIQDRHSQITSVSQERITHELSRVFRHANRRRGLLLLLESKLLFQTLPSVAAVAADESRWQRLLQIVEVLGEPKLEVVLAVILGNEGAALTSTGLTSECRRLKLSNELRKSTEWIVRHQSTLQRANDLKISLLQPLLIHDDIKSALSLMEAIACVDGSTLRHIEHCREQLSLPSEQLNPTPLIRGEDLGNLGLTPGPIFAKMLLRVREAQLDGVVATKSAALDLVRSCIKKN